MKRWREDIDWVTLGSLGWEIDLTGAGLGIEEPDRCHDDDYAHVDRRTGRTLVHGCPEFLARVANDMLSAGVLRQQGFHMPRVDVDTRTLTANYGANVQWNIVAATPWEFVGKRAA